MADSIGMRAASLTASATLMGAGVLVALTMTYAMPTLLRDDETPAITMERLETVTPPTPQRDLPRTAPPSEPHDVWPSLEDETFEQATLVEPPEAGAVGRPALTMITGPHWLRRPRDLQRYYPRRALAAEIEGDVVLDCRVTTAGLLDCAIVSETPTGRGFAEAALRIAAEHQMVPAQHDGAVVEGRYRMRVPFRVD